MAMTTRCSLLVVSSIALSLLAACSGTDESTTLPHTGHGDDVDASVEGGTSTTPPHGTGSEDAGTQTTIDSGPAPVPDVDAIAWKTGDDIGFGVAMKDTGNPTGTNMFIAYAGFDVNLESAEAWATALYKATLQAKGVRYIWAVQGPRESSYAGLEIGNTKIVTNLLSLMTVTTRYVLVAAHSSGSFVAHELLNQLAGGQDPKALTQGKVIYFNLDGGSEGASSASGLSSGTVARLHKAYFVSPYASSIDTLGLNPGDMKALGATYAAAGGYFTVDSNGAGCNAGATLCLHISLVITKPHNPASADAVADYSDFKGRPVTTAYLDAKATEAGLTP